MEKIHIQATKAGVKKVKTVTKKIQSTKVKKTAITWNNVKKTLTKIICKKGKLNKIPNISTATQGDKGYIQPE